MLTKLKLWWHKGRLSRLYDILQDLEISVLYCDKAMIQRNLHRIEEVQRDIRMTKYHIKVLTEGSQ